MHVNFLCLIVGKAMEQDLKQDENHETEKLEPDLVELEAQHHLLSLFVPYRALFSLPGADIGKKKGVKSHILLSME